LLFHCFNINIYPYLETSGGQSFNLRLNVVHFFNTSVGLGAKFFVVVTLFAVGEEGDAILKTVIGVRVMPSAFILENIILESDVTFSGILRIFFYQILKIPFF
jgi:hypothetical protein